MERSKKLFSPDNLLFGLVLGLSLLLPLFFLPVSGISLDVGKAFFVSVITILALILWFVGRLVDGQVKFPRSLLVAGVLAVALFTLFAGIASPAFQVSMFGQGFEAGTFAFILVASLLMLVVSFAANTRNRIFWIYAAFIASFALIALFQLVRLFAGPSVLSFGYFADRLSNMIGKWNDLAAFFGLIAVLALSTLEVLSVGRLYKFALYVSLIVSLFFLAVVNFTFAWGALAFISLFLFVYAIYLNKFEAGGSDAAVDSVSLQAPRVPLASLTVFLVSLFFLFTASTVGGQIAAYFNSSQVEVRPSWSATYDIAKQTLAQDALFGGGPNRFQSQWSLYKPDALNSTIFWSTDFNSGIGYIPTLIVTTGALGLLAWLFFFGIFLYQGVKSVMSFGLGRVSRYLVLSSFLSALFLWLFAIFYVPNVVVVTLAFIFTGLFVAVMVNENMSRSFEASLMGNPKIGFLSVLVIILLIVASAAFGYTLIEKTLSSLQFQKAVAVMNGGGSIDDAESRIFKAISLNPSDVYYRGASQIAMAKIDILFQQKDLKPEEARTKFTALMGDAIGSAKQAINYDSTNYVNWLNLGSVYEAVVPLGVNGAYDEADKAYRQALTASPKNPIIYYTLARLEVANKDTKTARVSLGKAIAMKSDYTDALFFLSQIEASEGNIKEAINRADQASLIAPDNVGLFFQLGLLKYTNKDYNGAITALERATSLAKDYANAMYFLGLSYDKVGRKDDAIAQFARISELNPDNKEIKTILKNLQSGREALATISPPQSAPEKKKTPPIKETAQPQADTSGL